jgi:hypothetical protein
MHVRTPSNTPSNTKNVFEHPFERSFEHPFEHLRKPLRTPVFNPPHTPLGAAGAATAPLGRLVARPCARCLTRVPHPKIERRIEMHSQPPPESHLSFHEGTDKKEEHGFAQSTIEATVWLLCHAPDRLAAVTSKRDEFTER